MKWLEKILVDLFKAIGILLLLLGGGVGIVLWALHATKDDPYISPPAQKSNSPKPEPWEIHSNIDQQPARLRMIKQWQEKGVIQKIEAPVRFPEVWVTPLFMNLDYDVKEDIADLILSYYLIESKGSLTIVYFKHSKSGNDVGKIDTLLGFRLH